MDDRQSTQRQWAGRVRDARGHPVALLDPYLLHKLRRHDVIPAEPLAEIARHIGSGWRKAGRVIFGNVAVSMLKHIHCPHCGYDIRGLPTDPSDGATVCPQCGCAWRLELLPTGEVWNED